MYNPSSHERDELSKLFSAVPLTSDDIKDVHDLLLHLAIDSNFLYSYLISHDEFVDDFLKKLFSCFVVCSRRSSFTRPLGLILFCEDFSFQHGHGLYLDSFYVVEGLRNIGLGRMLMKRLCEEVRLRQVNYIKLYFLNKANLRLIYSRMGFCNETLSDKKLQLMEVYGKVEIKKFVKRKFLPTKCFLYNEVVRSPVISTIGKSNVIMINVFQSGTNKMAGFVEQVVYCGWVGPTLIFKDFVGSTEILDLNLFKIELKERQLNEPQCHAMWWEVPETHDTLLETLASAGVRNVSKTEGWHIGCLYRDGSNDFSYFSKKYPGKRSVKCGTMSRFEVLYRNLYFC